MSLWRGLCWRIATLAFNLFKCNAYMLKTSFKMAIFFVLVFSELKLITLPKNDWSEEAFVCYLVLVCIFVFWVFCEGGWCTYSTCFDTMCYCNKCLMPYVVIILNFIAFLFHLWYSSNLEGCGSILKPLWAMVCCFLLYLSLHSRLWHFIHFMYET